MLGSILRTLGRRTEAMKHYQGALAINPDIAEVHSNMGVLHHDQGELEPPIACYREALLRAPGHVEARLNLAAALRALGRTDEGQAEIRRSLVTARGSAAHFDTALFTRDLEAGYREAWNIHTAGESPRHIAARIL